MKKFFLFLSAFVPMYFLVWTKLVLDIINHNLTFNVLNTTFFVFLIIVIVAGMVGVQIQIYDKKTEEKKVKVIECNNITDQHFLGYFSLFVLFAVTFDLSKVSMSIVFLLIIVMIGLVYIKNDLFYINPYLNILGYNFYKITYLDDNNESRTDYVFAKKKIQINKSYYIKFKTNFNFVDMSRQN